MRGWIEWFVKGLWNIRRPLQVVIAITAVFTLLVLWQNRNFRPDRTMHDAAFERAAVTICAKEIPPLRAVRREDDTDKNLEKETAAKINTVATKLSGVVDELRALEVKPQNRAQVDAWFAHFDDYVAAGQEYAAAIRRGHPAEYAKVDDKAVAPLAAISHFARANHIDACIP